MRCGRSGILLLAVLLTNGCGAGWHHEPLQPMRTVDPRQQVQVWANGKVLRWHALQLHQDSISGLPYVAALTCDSCRQTLPLAGVDSLRYGNPSAGFWKTIGVIMGSWLLIALAFCCPSST
jgi:hypothetical protein